MKAIPPIKAVMTPFPYWVEARRPIGEAMAMMEEHGIRHLAVKDGGELSGVITDRDIQKARGLHPSAEQLQVQEVCSRETYVVELSEPLDRVLFRMAEEHIGSAIVVKDDKLAGIFTTTDACRCFGDLLRSLFPGGGDEAA